MPKSYQRLVLLCLTVGVWTIAGCGPDNYAECTQFVESANAQYEACEEESPIPDSTCEPYRNVNANCTQFFECLTESYSCEEDGTMTTDTGACTGCI
jgi:hypothetical protein